MALTTAPLPAPGDVVAQLLMRFSGADDGMPDECPRPGSAVALHPHQRTAVRTLRSLLRRHGGALLADEPGMGKTFAALEVARPYRRVLVVAPAVLLPMWRDSAARSLVEISVVSYERLSARRTAPAERHDLLVLDEAHHVRNPATRRFGAVAQMAWGVPLLLLSATPIHNRRAELTALFSLFLGSGAHRLDDDELARLVVRRRAEHLSGYARLPALRTLRWESLPPSREVLAALLALPSPVPPADGGRADALLKLSLVRAWCSSDAALLDALHRRLTVAAALEHALAHGCHPSRRELRAWSGDGESIQLAMPQLLARSVTEHAGVSPMDGAAGRVTALLDSVLAHAAAVRALRDLVLIPLARDTIRFVRLREVLLAYAGLRAVVFTHSRATARAAYRALAPSTRCALITGQAGLIASGALPRAELLARFASADRTGARPSPSNADAMRLDVLVATDVLSEGVNLPAAGLVVHLDLPWTPARLEQRVGRARRLGSSLREVIQVAIAPPADAAELRAVVRHLAEKSGIARRLVGDALPPGAALIAAADGDGDRDGDEGAADAAESLRRLCGALGRRGVSLHDEITEEASAAALPAMRLRSRDPRRGALALVEHGDEVEVVAVRDEAPSPSLPSADPRIALQLLRSSHIGCVERERSPGSAAEPSAGRGVERELTTSPGCARSDGPWLRQARELCAAWCRARDAEDSALADVAVRSRAHGALLRRIAASAAGVGRMGRGGRVALAAAARTAVLATAGVGGEQVLALLLREAPTLPAAGAGAATGPATEAGDGTERRWLEGIVARLRERGHPCRRAAGGRRVAALLLTMPNE